MDASKLDLSALPELTVSLATDGRGCCLDDAACRYVAPRPERAIAPPRRRRAPADASSPSVPSRHRNVILGQSLFESFAWPTHGRVAAGRQLRARKLRRGRMGCPPASAPGPVRGGPSSPLSWISAGRVHQVRNVAAPVRRSAASQGPLPRSRTQAGDRGSAVGPPRRDARRARTPRAAVDNARRRFGGGGQGASGLRSWSSACRVASF